MDIKNKSASSNCDFCQMQGNFTTDSNDDIHNLSTMFLNTMDCSHIQFCTDKQVIDLQQLGNLLSKTAFWAKERNCQDLQIAIANSNPVVTVWDYESLIGFARATSDGIYRAAIWDVVIDPDYQGRGLGRKLVETVLSHPIVNKVERVYLTTTHQQSFYERIGFEVNDTTTMVLHNSNPVAEISQLQSVIAVPKV